MQPVLAIALLAMVFFLVHEGFRGSGKSFAWFTFLVLPCALTPYWILNNEFELFAFGKLYTILLTACWLTSLRFTQLIHRNWTRIGLIMLFALNILEAVAVDLAAWRLAPGMNAVAGIVLVAMLPRSASVINRIGNHAMLQCEGLSRMWILAFTLWNHTFLYIQFPVIFGHHIAVLGVPLIIGMYKPHSWLQARIYLLAIDLVALATFGPFLVPLLDTTKWHAPHWEIAAAGTTLVLSLTCLAVRVLGWKQSSPTKLAGPDSELGLQETMSTGV